MNKKIVFLFLSFNCLAQIAEAQKTYEVSWTDYGKGFLPKQHTSIAYWQEYNADNQLTEQRYLVEGGKEKKIIYHYNDKKKLVLEEESPLDSWMPVKKYTYDASGSLTEASWKRRDKSDDTVFYHETYRYDGDGRLTLKEQNNTMRNKVTTHIWKYSYEKDGTDTKVIETYFINNKKKKGLRYEIFNDKGLIILTREQYHQKKYTYEYNTAGDWIVQKVCVKESNIGDWRCEGEFRRVEKSK